MIEIVAYGQVKEDGALEMFNKSIFVEEARINLRGKKFKIVLTENFDGVPDYLRKYYFGIMLGHATAAFNKNGMNYSKKEVDERLRRMFLVKENVDQESGEIIVETKSLSKEANEVSHEEMREFIRLVIAFAAEHLEYGIPYPLEY